MAGVGLGAAVTTTRVTSTEFDSVVGVGEGETAVATTVTDLLLLDDAVLNIVTGDKPKMKTRTSPPISSTAITKATAIATIVFSLSTFAPHPVLPNPPMDG
jgi:hypothetical protein